MIGFTTHYDFFLYPNNTVGMALKTRINIQSDILSGIVWKMVCRNAKLVVFSGFLTYIDSSLRPSITLIRWATSNVVKAIFLAYVNCSISFWKAMIKDDNDTILINKPRLTILKLTPRANIPSLGSL